MFPNAFMLEDINNKAQTFLFFGNTVGFAFYVSIVSVSSLVS